MVKNTTKQDNEMLTERRKWMFWLSILALVGLAYLESYIKQLPMHMELSFNGSRWGSCSVEKVHGLSDGFTLTCVQKKNERTSLSMEVWYSTKRKLRLHFNVDGSHTLPFAPVFLHKDKKLKRFPFRLAAKKGACRISEKLVKKGLDRRFSRAGMVGLLRIETWFTGSYQLFPRRPALGTYRFAIQKPCGVLTVKFKYDKMAKTMYTGF